MIKIILLLVISQGMGYPLRDSLSEFELQPVPIDTARMEKLESVVNELLKIIKHSDQLDVHEDLINKTRQLDRERNTLLESRPYQDLTSQEIEKLFRMELKFIDMITVHSSKARLHKALVSSLLC